MNEQGGQQAQPPTVPVAVGLTYVCRHLEDICEVLALDGDEHDGRVPPVVRRVAQAARAGEDLREPLDRLHAALLNAGDPRGIWGATRALLPSGIEADLPFEPVYSCPHGHCSGYSTESAAAALFVCALTRQPLARDML